MYFQKGEFLFIKFYTLGRYYVQGVFIMMLSNTDNILPVSMRWIYNFFYYWPVTVTIHSGDMNKNLKLNATLQFAHFTVSGRINTMMVNRSLCIESALAKFLAASASNHNDTTATKTEL